MAQLIVRNLDETVKAGLRQRAIQNGHSLEAEARTILSAAVNSKDEAPKKLGTWIKNQFKGAGLKKPIEELRNWKIEPAQFD